ncbi:MAG: DUF4398 domain-containing protein [Ghiorsea sp.]|nr:DUF4398 domain-containing protein [Ghiorsea sp.]
MTAQHKQRTLGLMMRTFLISCLLLVLSSCASKPPVQAMAEARAAVQSVRVLYVDKEAQQQKAYKHYQSAEQSLLEATQALDEKRYKLAKRKARQAKRQARLAAKIK